MIKVSISCEAEVGGGGRSKGGGGEAFQLTERLLLWTGREGILNIWLAGRGGRG